MQNPIRRLVSPKHFPFYYGWFLLPFAALGVIMSIPGQTAGFSAFTESLLRVTGISRTRLSLLYMIGTLVSGFLLPFMGPIIDRKGSRIMMTVASLSLALTLLLLSRLESLAVFEGLVSLSLVYSIALALGIFALRFFGQGMLPLTANTMIGKWFHLNRGKAFAFIGIANSIAFSAAPAILAGFVLAFGWSGAWRIIGITVGSLMTVVALLFYRNTPEEEGIAVDGGISVKTGEDRTAPALTGHTRREALKTRAFWAVVLGLAANALVNTGLTFHIQAIGAEAGISLARAVAVFIPASIITVPLGFSASILTERIPAKFFIVSLALAQLLSYISVQFMSTPVGYLMLILGLGLSGGFMAPLQTAIIPKLFGRLHLGSLNGVVVSITVIASAIGPFTFSLINDQIGSLRAGITLMSIIPIFSLFFACRMKERPEQ